MHKSVGLYEEEVMKNAVEQLVVSPGGGGVRRDDTDTWDCVARNSQRQPPNPKNITRTRFFQCNYAAVWVGNSFSSTNLDLTCREIEKVAKLNKKVDLLYRARDPLINV